MAKILIVVNEDRFFLSHRKDIALRAQQEGHDVIVVCKDTGQHAKIKALGLRVINLPVNPTGMSLMEELKTYRFLCRLYKREKPDLVHHVGLKNILWGGLAAKHKKVHGVVNAVSGLGVLFSGYQPSRLASAILRVMAYASNRPRVKAIFQNPEDQSLFIMRDVVGVDQCEFIKGSGVDLHEYGFVAEPDSEKIRVIFTARMLKEKGVLTLIKAAEILREEYVGKVEFLLCGGLSNNPNGIQKEELEAYCDGSYIQWLGHRSDVKQLLESSHIMAFPSYYREGVPRSLIEACAIGRPIVTCDSIGCKDAVDEGVNGFLIKPDDAKALALKLKKLFESPSLRMSMGAKGRVKAEMEFDLNFVLNKHMEIYRSLLQD